MTEIRGESKKRKRELDEFEITPTPHKFVKMEEKHEQETSQMSPFEALTEDVVEKQMFPFLTDKDLAQLSKTSTYEQDLTETKRGLRFAQQEAEKARIVKEIQKFLELDDPFEGVINFSRDMETKVFQLIVDIWKIPFHQEAWNRPKLILPLALVLNQNIFGPIIASKMTLADLKSLSNTDFSEGLRNNKKKLDWILSSNLTDQQKKELVQKFFSSINSSRDDTSYASFLKMMDLWRLIIRPIIREKNVAHAKLLSSELEKFLSNEYYKLRAEHSWGPNMEFNEFLSLIGSSRRV